MIGGAAISRRYARALFSLGLEEGEPAGLLAEVNEFTKTVADSPELRRVLFTPVHPRKERRGVIRELAEALGVSAIVRSFVMILVDENRTVLLPAIRDSLEDLVEQAAGRVSARVTSAVELTPAQLEEIRASLSSRVGADVSLETVVDPALIGGVIARVGWLVLDGSVRTQLESLRGSLRKGTA